MISGHVMSCTASAKGIYAAATTGLLINGNGTTVVVQSCRPSEFVSNVWCGALSDWDRDRDELH
jgi:hypothetical protein